MDNLEIKIELISPAVLANNPFDGLLAKLFFQGQKETGTFNGDYQQELTFLERDPSGFYHVSSPVYDIKSLNNMTIFKSFNDKEYRDMFPNEKFTKALADKSRGPYKSHMIEFEQAEIDSVVFFVRGDTNTIAGLLENLRFLGKKASLGFGEISKIIVKKIPEDRSVVSNGVLMRPVPVNSKWVAKVSDSKSIGAKLYPLSHPYWDKGREEYVMVNIGAENGL